MLLVIFTVALFIVIIAAAARLYRPKRGAQPPEEQKPAYSTVLHMSRELGGGEAGCRDGVIYYRGREIGRYEFDAGHERWRVYDAEDCEIGSFSKGSGGNGDIYVHLSLWGLERKCPSLHDRVCAAPHGPSWTAAETWSGGVQCIADHETNDTLAEYSGDPIEASAAFICWARESSGNIYSGYYRL